MTNTEELVWGMAYAAGLTGNGPVGTARKCADKAIEELRDANRKEREAHFAACQAADAAAKRAFARKPEAR